MIKEVYIENFRNLSGSYVFKKKINAIFGENSTGKTNLLDAIRLAFSTLNGDYFRIQKSDFLNSDDTKKIVIKVLLENNSIPSFNSFDKNGNELCGFSLCIIKRYKSGKYQKKIFNYDFSPIDSDIYLEDENIPIISSHPITRIEDIFNGSLSTGLSTFLESNSEYKTIKEESKEQIREKIKDKLDKYKNLCSCFNKDIDIAFTEAKITDEKIYIVDGKEEHNYLIGSGFKSLANIMLNGINNKYVILLIDEIENHLHPSMLRLFLKTIKNFPKCEIICTTHSPIVTNELEIDELIYSKGNKFNDLENNNLKKLKLFLHPGRGELLFAENVVLVEGYTEELILRYYTKNNNLNWTIVNVAGLMFEPYVDLCSSLNKKVVVVTDTDIVLNDGKNPTTRFNNISTFCNKKGIKILQTFNTLESDLYKNGILGEKFEYLLKNHDSYSDIKIAINGKKTEIAEKIVLNNIDLSNWHIIKEIKDEFTSN